VRLSTSLTGKRAVRLVTADSAAAAPVRAAPSGELTAAHVPARCVRWADRLRLLRHLARSPSRLVASIALLGILTLAIGAPIIAPHNPNEIHLGARLLPGFWSSRSASMYLLGTDQVGRDELSRLIWGARISVFVGLASSALTGTIGVALGLAAAYHRGAVDYILVSMANVAQSLPFIVLALAFVAVLGPSLVNIIIGLGVTGSPLFFRVARGQALVVMQADYVLAARASGSRDRRIMLKHILPNVANAVIVLASLQVANMILAESFISYVGLGIQPPTPTWGNMLADSRTYLLSQWWLATFPGIAILLTVLGVNFVGDWLRDMLDPQLRTVESARTGRSA
jgi:peptide/nickel transport system permease protein